MTFLPYIISSIAVDSRTKSHLIQVFLKQSKTDPFKQGATVYTGVMGTTIYSIKPVILQGKDLSSLPRKKKAGQKSMFRVALQYLLEKLKLKKALQHPQLSHRSSNHSIISKYCKYTHIQRPKKYFTTEHSASNQRIGKILQITT